MSNLHHYFCKIKLFYFHPYQPKLFIIIPILFCSAAYSQKQGQELIDSLLTAIASTSNDTLRIRTLKNAAMYYSDVNTDSSLKYASIGMHMANKMRWDKARAAFCTSYGNVYTSKGQLDSALHWHLLALDISKKINDVVNQSVTYSNLGGVALAKSDFVAATNYFMNALQLGEDLKNNYCVGLAANNLALVYQQQEDYKKGIEYAKQSIVAYKTIKGFYDLSHPLSLIGSLFLQMQQYDSAFSYYQKALLNAQENGNKFKEAGVLASLARYYDSQKDYFSAIEYSLASKKIWDITEPDYEDALNNTGMLGYHYLQLSKQLPLKKISNSPEIPMDKEKLLQLATTYLEEAVTKTGKASNKASQSEFQKYLAEANALAGNYKAAYFNYKSYDEVNDSIYSQESKNKIAALESKQQMEEKDKQLLMNKLDSINERKIFIAFLAALGLVAIIVLLFYNRKLNQKNNELATKNKEIEEALYKGQTFERKRVAIELHDTISSLLSAAKISMEVLNPQNMSAYEQKVYANVLQLMDNACKEVRHVSHNMVPPELEKLGLAQVLENLLDKLNKLGVVKFNLDVSGLVPLTKVAAFNLYSICLELTNNILKHAKATQAAIRFTHSDQELHLFVSDNGTGMAKQSLDGMGLRNIRSRIEAMNGTMEKQSSETGTVFWFVIPLAETLVLAQS